jgi:hypothetical protein
VHSFGVCALPSGCSEADTEVCCRTSCAMYTRVGLSTPCPGGRILALHRFCQGFVCTAAEEEHCCDDAPPTTHFSSATIDGARVVQHRPVGLLLTSKKKANEAAGTLGGGAGPNSVDRTAVATDSNLKGAAIVRAGGAREGTQGNGRHAVEAAIPTTDFGLSPERIGEQKVASVSFAFLRDVAVAACCCCCCRSCCS